MPKTTKEVKVGAYYACRVRGKETVVQVQTIDTSGYKKHSTVRIVCEETRTGRTVIVRAPSRLREAFYNEVVKRREKKR